MFIASKSGTVLLFLQSVGDAINICSIIFMRLKTYVFRKAAYGGPLTNIVFRWKFRSVWLLCGLAAKKTTEHISLL